LGGTNASREQQCRREQRGQTECFCLHHPDIRMNAQNPSPGNREL
jgi:hypothetical protein